MRCSKVRFTFHVSVAIHQVSGLFNFFQINIIFHWQMSQFGVWLDNGGMSKIVSHSPKTVGSFTLYTEFFPSDSLKLGVSVPRNFRPLSGHKRINEFGFVNFSFEKCGRLLKHYSSHYKNFVDKKLSWKFYIAALDWCYRFVLRFGQFQGTK